MQLADTLHVARFTEDGTALNGSHLRGYNIHQYKSCYRILANYQGMARDGLSSEWLQQWARTRCTRYVHAIVSLTQPSEKLLQVRRCRGKQAEKEDRGLRSRLQQSSLVWLCFDRVRYGW